MYLKTTYDQEFDDLMMYLKSKYPQRLFDLEGIGVQTDMGAFSKRFFSEITTTADGSVDANSNVDDLTVVAYENELPKPFSRLNSLYLLWKYGRKLFGKEYANKMIEYELTGAYYINDLSNVQKPYSYDGSTSIHLFRSDNTIGVESMRDLFKQYEDEKETLPDRETIDLREKGIRIYDGDNEWVNLKYVLRHKRDKRILALATIRENEAYYIGYPLRVTEDHPIIMADGREIPAGEIKIGDEIAVYDKNLGNKITRIVDITDMYKDEYVYDITTETGTFYSGGVKCHNCFNFSTYDLMTKGLPFVNKIASGPPKHLSSFTGQLIHFTSYASNQVLGAR